MEKSDEFRTTCDRLKMPFSGNPLPKGFTPLAKPAGVQDILSQNDALVRFAGTFVEIKK
jgi:hypothetical protein